MGEVQDVRDVKKTFVAPAIKSFEHYDFSRAKISCSLTWLGSKAYGTGRIFTLYSSARCVDEFHVQHTRLQPLDLMNTMPTPLSGKL